MNNAKWGGLVLRVLLLSRSADQAEPVERASRSRLGLYLLDARGRHSPAAPSMLGNGTSRKPCGGAAGAFLTLGLTGHACS
jgi:hypothetical protein